MYSVLTQIIKKPANFKPQDYNEKNFRLLVNVSFFQPLLQFETAGKTSTEDAQTVRLVQSRIKHTPVLSTKKSDPKAPKNDPSMGRYSKFSTPR
jgi:hypothetical protein